MKEYIKFQRWVEINEGGGNPKKRKRDFIIFATIMTVCAIALILSLIMLILGK